MMILQAIPPPPPSVPFDPNLFLMNADAPALVMMVVTVMAAVTIVLWPLARALARRLEGRGVSQDLLQQVDELRERVRDLESSQHRVAELEERLDFTERLLAQRRDVELPRN